MNLGYFPNRANLGVSGDVWIMALNTVPGHGLVDDNQNNHLDSKYGFSFLNAFDKSGALSCYIYEGISELDSSASTVD